MRCYKTTRAFAQQVCKATNQTKPDTTCYITEHESGHTTVTSHPPRQYRGVKRTVFCVNGDRCVERRYGVWVETPGHYDDTPLFQRAVFFAVQSLYHNRGDLKRLATPDHLDRKLRRFVDRYIERAQAKHRRDYNRKVISEAIDLMKNDNVFQLLKDWNDPRDC